MRSRDILLLCPSGFERIVSSAAAQDLPGFRALEMSPGYVRFRAVAAVKTLSALAYATNVFDVVASVQRSDFHRELKGLSSAVIAATRPTGLPQTGAFRLRIFDDGRFVTTATREAARLTTVLASWSGLRHEPRGGQLEFWVIRRRDSKQAVLGTRLGRHRPAPPRGSLRPEIAAALARTVPLDRRDTVLDPFAGSGVIGIAALDAGAGRVWLNDLSRHSLGLVRGLPGPVRRRIRQTHVDIRNLPDAGGPDVTAVISDPPWGLYKESPQPIDALYADVASAMSRMLASGRPMVILTGAPPFAEESLTRSGHFTLMDGVAVLVNGKKARVLCMERTSRPAEAAEESEGPDMLAGRSGERGRRR